MRQVANQSNEALIMRFLVDGGSRDGSGCRVSMVGEVSIPMINNHSSFLRTSAYSVKRELMEARSTK